MEALSARAGEGVRAAQVAPLESAAPLLADPERLRAAAAERGYLFFPGLVPDAPLRTMRRHARAAAAELGLVDVAPGTAARVLSYTSPAWVALQQRVALLPAFVALSEHPAILAVLAVLFDAPALPHRGDVCRIAVPGAPELATPPHQDAFFLRTTPFPRRDGIWSAWLPLGTTPLAVGPLAVLAGSHRGGLRAHLDTDGAGPRIVDLRDDDRDWRASGLRRGDVLFVNSFTVHRALPNLTRARVRLSVDFRYEPAR